MPYPDSDADPPLHVVSLAEGGLAARLGQGPLALGYRPIAELERAEAVGYEVLLAGPDASGTALETPAAWSRRGHAVEAGAVEARLVSEALRAREELPPGAFLLVKVSTRALLGEALRAAFAAAGDLGSVVVAVADDADPAETPAVGRALECVRRSGARFAVDDAGAGNASLQQVVRLRPDLVRVGATFTEEVDRDPAQAAVIEALVAVASRVGARVIAAEVPGPSELRAVMRMGVPLAEGPVFGAAPEPEMGGLSREAAALIAAGRIPRRFERTVAEALEPLEPLEAGMSTADIADRFLADPRHDALVAIDPEGRPAALLDRAALLRGEPYALPPLIVTPDAPLSEAVRRATSRPHDDRLRPLVCSDARGRYLGILRIERLLDALAAEGAPGRRPAHPDRRRGPRRPTS